MCSTYESSVGKAWAATMNFYGNRMFGTCECSHCGRAFDFVSHLHEFISDLLILVSSSDWSTSDHGPVHRQLSVSSDSKLLDDDIREESRVIMRPKKPPRPKSEVFLNKHESCPRRKRFSAFGVSCHLLKCFRRIPKGETFTCLHNLQNCICKHLHIHYKPEHDSLRNKKFDFCTSFQKVIGLIGNDELLVSEQSPTPTTS